MLIKMDSFEEMSPPAQLTEDNSVEVVWCVVCCSKVIVTPIKNEILFSGNSGISESDKRLERNLDVVFLLRNLMKVPSNHLERDLKEFGDNPEDWLSLCDKCTKFTRQARRLHQRIIETEKELKCIQKIIISQTRSSSKRSSVNDNLHLHYPNHEIWSRTRCFVKNYGYPFTATLAQSQSSKLIVEGDKLANYLANQQRTSSSTTTSCTILIPENLENDNCTTTVTTAPSPGQINEEPDSSILPDDPPDEDNQEKIDSIRQQFLDALKNHKKKKKPPSAYTSKRQYKHYKIIDGKYKCRQCDELFFSGIACYVHEREKHCSNPGQYVCDICGRKFNSSAYLVSHRRSLHKLKQSRAPVKVVPKKKVSVPVPVPVAEGLPMVKEPKRYACHLCPKSYAGSNPLKYHIKFDHEKVIRENLICKLCPGGGKAWSSKKDLVIHQFARHKDSEEVKKMREEGRNVWICEVVGCVDRFITESGLENHRKRYHGGGGGEGGVKRFTCAYCGDGFWRENQLRNHERIHYLKETGEKPFVCELCGKGFNTSRHLKQHKEGVHWKIKKKGKKKDGESVKERDQEINFDNS